MAGEMDKDGANKSMPTAATSRAGPLTPKDDRK